MGLGEEEAGFLMAPNPQGSQELKLIFFCQKEACVDNMP